VIQPEKSPKKKLRSQGSHEFCFCGAWGGWNPASSIHHPGGTGPTTLTGWVWLVNNGSFLWLIIMIISFKTWLVGSPSVGYVGYPGPLNLTAENSPENRQKKGNDCLLKFTVFSGANLLFVSGEVYYIHLFITFDECLMFN